MRCLQYIHFPYAAYSIPSSDNTGSDERHDALYMHATNSLMISVTHIPFTQYPKSPHVIKYMVYTYIHAISIIFKNAFIHNTVELLFYDNFHR